MMKTTSFAIAGAAGYLGYLGYSTVRSRRS